MTRYGPPSRIGREHVCDCALQPGEDQIQLLHGDALVPVLKTEHCRARKADLLAKGGVGLQTTLSAEEYGHLMVQTFSHSNRLPGLLFRMRNDFG
jgi:hypothetical protein